jgi:hypothetical protein
MHKDKPPGPFDFAERSIRYLVGFWVTAGLILSILVHTTMLVWRADRKNPDSKPNQEALEAATAARRAADSKAPPPDAPPAVKY